MTTQNLIYTNVLPIRLHVFNCVEVRFTAKNMYKILFADKKPHGEKFIVEDKDLLQLREKAFQHFMYNFLHTGVTQREVKFVIKEVIDGYEKAIRNKKKDKLGVKFDKKCALCGAGCNKTENGLTLCIECQEKNNNTLRNLWWLNSQCIKMERIF